MSPPPFLKKFLRGEDVYNQGSQAKFSLFMKSCTPPLLQERIYYFLLELQEDRNKKGGREEERWRRGEKKREGEGEIGKEEGEGRRREREREDPETGTEDDPGRGSTPAEPVLVASTSLGSISCYN